jgi:hypothetical protein
VEKTTLFQTRPFAVLHTSANMMLMQGAEKCCETNHTAGKESIICKTLEIVALVLHIKKI